jgi:hypothetical protein
MSGMSAISGSLGSTTGLSAFQDRLFAKVDTNSDGQISPGELAAFGQNLPGANGASGNSTQDLFNKIDTNGDGSISLAEFQSYGQQQAQARAALLQVQEQSGSLKPHHHHHHHASSESGQTPPTDPTALFNQIDTNQDGSISASEWAAAFGKGNSTAVSAGAQTASTSAADPLLQALNTLA